MRKVVKLDINIKLSKVYDPVIQGIYCISNTLNGHRYIGSSVDVLFRLYTHRSRLRNGSHCNKHLQRAFKMYGEENFRLYYVEIKNADSTTLRIIENHFIILNGYYNMVKSFKLPKEVIVAKRNPKEFKRSHYNLKPFNQYNLDGKFVKTWYDGQADCARKLNISSSNINRALKNKKGRVGKYIFKYTSELSDVLPFKFHHAKHSIFQYDLKGNLINEWEQGVPEILTIFGNSQRAGLYQNIKGNKKSAYGFIWSKVKLLPDNKLFKPKYKPIKQLTVSRDIIKTWKDCSLRSISREANVGMKGLVRVLNKKQSSTKGYIFEYVN